VEKSQGHDVLGAVVREVGLRRAVITVGRLPGQQEKGREWKVKKKIDIQNPCTPKEADEES